MRFLKEILVDIETYSEVDIGKCGLYRYATDPSTEILLIAWATDEGSGFGETQCADIATGEAFPQELLEAFKDSSVKLIAHNAAFERVNFSCYLSQHYPGQYLEPGSFLSPDNWICTMVMAAAPAAGLEGCRHGAEDESTEGQGGRTAHQTVFHALQAHKDQWDAHQKPAKALPGRLGEVQVLLHSGCQHRGGHLQTAEEVSDAGTGMAALPHQ